MKRARPYSAPAKKKYAKTSSKKSVSSYNSSKSSTPVRLVRRNVDEGTIVATLSTTTFGAFSFRLNEVPNYTEFTAMYDQYKINAISITFYPQLTGVTSYIGSTTIQNARFLTAIDLTDNTPPSQMDDLREYENCECHSATETFTVYISNPRFIDSNGALRTGYLATTSPSTTYYGLKYGLDILSPSAAGTYTYRCEAVYYMSFKAIK